MRGRCRTVLDSGPDISTNTQNETAHVPAMTGALGGRRGGSRIGGSAARLPPSRFSLRESAGFRPASPSENSLSNPGLTTAQLNLKNGLGNLVDSLATSISRRRLDPFPIVP
jgi:hypothetical protein